MVKRKPEEGEYPKRESHFAHRVIRLLVRTCAAQEIGSDGCLLVVVIAHTEHAKWYTSPVTFWNDQLMSVLGFTWGKLDRARKKAVAAGWLHYDPGGKGKVGKYWSTIPKDYMNLPDTPVDEDMTHDSITLSSPPVEREAGEKRGTNGGQTGDKCGTFIPIPKPIQEDSCPELSQATDAGPPDPSEFVFPTKGKGAKTWTLPKAKLTEYEEAFPGVDVDQELRRARQWCRDNPTKRKTATGMLGFLTRWLGKEQNSRSNGNGHATPDPDPTPIIRATTPPPKGYEA